MKLHRTTGQPDWATIENGRWNGWQRTAAATAGIVTPANIATLLGFAIVLYGVMGILGHHYWTALVALAGGRLFDIADGWLAETTGTKSPLGEMLDAGLDKIGTALTVVAMFVAGVAEMWQLLALFVPQVIIALISFIQINRGRKVHPSRTGKNSMFVAWVSLLGLIIVGALQLPANSIPALAIDALVIGSAGMALYAAYGYATGRD
jgi:phosphatidylglycerophosphate synthase